MLPAAGLLVGFGAALGSGCTSGHGICGLARLSFRSLVAVLSFMTSGLITVYLIRICYRSGHKTIFLVFCSGVIFGAGLAVSGMLSPAKVAGFLDLFGCGTRHLPLSWVVALWSILSVSDSQPDMANHYLPRGLCFPRKQISKCRFLLVQRFLGQVGQWPDFARSRNRVACAQSSRWCSVPVSHVCWPWRGSFADTPAGRVKSCSA